MTRLFTLLVAALALVAATVVPYDAARATQVNPQGPGDVAKSPTGSYVVVMAADPLVVTEGKDRLNTNRARNRGRALRAGHDKALRAVGARQSDKLQDYTVALNGFAAVLDHDDAQELALRKDVALVVPDVLRQPQTDASPAYLELTAPGGAWTTGVKGDGVVVGVIDTGIWPEHPSFADDGSYPAPPVSLDEDACEFGNTAHNPNDAAFECNNKLIGARQTLDTYRALIGADPDEFDSARDDDGHGTHTASTAAGNEGVHATLYGREAGTVSGIAPRAHVIAYKGLGNLGGFTSDLAAAIDQAVTDGVDVINYSIGGGATLTGADDLAYLFAAQAGVFVATSAGNSGPGAATIGGPASVPWLTSVGANTQTRFFQGRITLGDGRTFTGASITGGTDGSAPLVDAADIASGTDPDLCVPGTLDPAGAEGAIVLCRRGAIARVDKSLAVQQAGGVGMVMYENDDRGDLFTDTHWVPSVHIDNTPGLQIKDYIADAGQPTASITSDGAGEWPYAPSMTSFSSRGPDPVAEDIIKPDITAPGFQILAGNSPFPDAGSYPGELFQAIAGTSMSSPHVAGVFALLKQAHPDWTPAMAKSAVMTTADPDVLNNDRATAATPFAMGSGELDPGARVRKGSAFQPGLVYNAGLNDYLGFLCDAAPEVFRDANATCGSLADAGVATDAHNLNYPSIGVAELAGSETVTRTVTSVAQERGNQTYTVDVDAPDGYDVTVSPSSFTIRSGQSVTYSVTITNNGRGAVGEWAFGSLTWNDRSGSYSVRSPIAVKGAVFAAPDELTATGTSGSASFDVSFGYSGTYTAAGHGPVPAEVTTDTVVQDPDQAFDRADGFSNVHEFDLDDVAHLRIAIPQEATEENADLDVFVFDPGGDLVATSTSGGTDEQIDLTFPEDGTWEVWVHGWQTIGVDAEYDLSSWVVPATPGDDLALGGVPSTATIGTTATLSASWDGLAAGVPYLGAVSHADGDGPLSLTLLNIDTR